MTDITISAVEPYDIKEDHTEWLQGDDGLYYTRIRTNIPIDPVEIKATGNEPMVISSKTVKVDGKNVTQEIQIPVFA